MASHDAGEIASNLQPIGGPKAGFNLSQFGFLKRWAEGLSTSWLLGSELLSDKIERKCLSIECVRIA